MVKNLPANAEYVRDLGFDPWVGKIPYRRAWQPTPVFLLGKSHGQRSLVDLVHGVSHGQTTKKQLSKAQHHFRKKMHHEQSNNLQLLLNFSWP